MAKQKGNLKITGTMNDMTFYKMGNKYFVRAKRQVSRERILTDPKFGRVRENANEFGSAVRAGKLLRECVNNMFKEAGNRITSERVLQMMLKIQKSDLTSERGKRNAGIALASPAAKKLLKGFEFNDKSKIGNILFKSYTVDIISGLITITNLIPSNDVLIPKGATHLTLSGAYVNVNFSNGQRTISYTNEVNLPIEGASTTILLTPATIPTGTGTKLYFLQIEFFQMVNGLQYELNNGSFNAVVIADAA